MLEENKHFTIKMVGNKMLFTWKEIPLFTKEDYKFALSRIAFHCSQQTPLAIIINKLVFQPKVFFNKDWYTTHVLPNYHKAGILYLGHITGKVDSYKLLPISSEFNFKNVEFKSVQEALNWEAK